MNKIKSYTSFIGRIEEEGAATWFLTRLTLYTRRWASLDFNEVNASSTLSLMTEECTLS